jgi:hypothetical protein
MGTIDCPLSLMETKDSHQFQGGTDPMLRQEDSGLKIVSITSGRPAAAGVISQTEMRRGEQLERKMKDAERLRDKTEAEYSAWSASIQQALEKGAVIEPGPLQATIKTRAALILHSSKKKRA